eukprot:m.73268 g.73268  ORF g.73268 m.73268 type:complete len:108 (-) comp18791_c0_seq1:747-1070(-)
MAPAQRSALGLFAKFIRLARAMPTTERRDFVLRKARDGFRSHRDTSVADLGAVWEHAEVMLDQLEIQCEHLNECAAAGVLKNGTLVGTAPRGAESVRQWRPPVNSEH